MLTTEFSAVDASSKHGRSFHHARSSSDHDTKRIEKHICIFHGILEGGVFVKLCAQAQHNAKDHGDTTSTGRLKAQHEKKAENRKDTKVQHPVRDPRRLKSRSYPATSEERTCHDAERPKKCQ
jgi:hypothetical protein